MKYDVVVFDVDGTLIDTKETILLSLQHMLFRVTGRLYQFKELYFALGITGEEALRRLRVPDREAAMDTWLYYNARYEYLQKPFADIAEMVRLIGDAGIHLGIVTSRTCEEFQKGVSIYPFVQQFQTIVCADHTKKHKPDPEPMLELLDRTGAKASQVLYIGDSPYDMECAHKAGVDSALALWGAQDPEGVVADYRLKNVSDIELLLRNG